MIFAAEKYCLVHWPEEESVSAVVADDLPEAKVGAEWQVKRGKQSYVGHIAAIGECLCCLVLSWDACRGEY